MLIVEGYGLTESSAASFVNLPSDFKFGTVGKPIPGVELSFLEIPAEEGTEAKQEILIHGRGIMRGYYNLPEASAEVFHIDENGKKWLRTGDAGELDSDGFLKITDRIKNLIKTSGGKYVAPQKWKDSSKPFRHWYLKHLFTEINMFCSMLLTVDPDALATWAEEARPQWYELREELTQHDSLKSYMQTSIDELNKQ